jgi:hypothetical protein
VHLHAAPQHGLGTLELGSLLLLAAAEAGGSEGCRRLLGQDLQ